MNEYELHTQGARHSFEPPYDGNDRGRNRPLTQSEVDIAFEAAKSGQPICEALLRLVEAKFASGNAIPVERITITRTEWDAALSATKGESNG